MRKHPELLSGPIKPGDPSNIFENIEYENDIFQKNMKQESGNIGSIAIKNAKWKFGNMGSISSKTKALNELCEPLKL